MVKTLGGTVHGGGGSVSVSHGGGSASHGGHAGHAGHCGTRTGHARGHAGSGTPGSTAPDADGEWVDPPERGSGVSPSARSKDYGFLIFALFMSPFLVSAFFLASRFSNPSIFGVIIVALGIVAPVLVVFLAALGYEACRALGALGYRASTRVHTRVYTPLRAALVCGRADSAASQAVVVLYRGSLAASAASMYLYWGRDGWHQLTDTPMTRQARGSWLATVIVPAGTALNAAFHDGQDQWDNNGLGGYAINPPVNSLVSSSPVLLASGGQATIRYNGSLAASAASLTLHWGHDGWDQVTDTLMTRDGDGSWQAVISVPAGSMLDAALVNQAGQWDNNGGGDYGLAIRSKRHTRSHRRPVISGSRHRGTRTGHVRGHAGSGTPGSTVLDEHAGWADPPEGGTGRALSDLGGDSVPAPAMPVVPRPELEKGTAVCLFASPPRHALWLYRLGWQRRLPRKGSDSFVLVRRTVGVVERFPLSEEGWAQAWAALARVDAAAARWTRAVLLGGPPPPSPGDRAHVPEPAAGSGTPDSTAPDKHAGLADPPLGEMPPPFWGDRAHVPEPAGQKPAKEVSWRLVAFAVLSAWGLAEGVLAASGGIFTFVAVVLLGLIMVPAVIVLLLIVCAFAWFVVSLPVKAATTALRRPRRAEGPGIGAGQPGGER
jgi:Starch/carbohydrate-binding module (family 53)